MTLRFIFAILAIITSVSCDWSVKPSKAVDAFLRAVERGDIDGAAAHFSSGFISRRGVEMLKSDLRDVSLELKEHGGIKSIKFLKEDVIGDVGEVTVEVRRGNDYIVTVHYKLVKEQGSWRIDDIAGGPGRYESRAS